jgi:hypothetical protein
MRNYGFKMSKLTGQENEFTVFNNTGLPKKYSYKNYLPAILNQGSYPLCVPCALSAYLDWNYNVDTNGKIFKENKIVLKDIYNARKDKTRDDGMQIKDALEYLKHSGVRFKNGIIRIKDYARVTNIMSLKYALIMNGPCVGALRVYDDQRVDFWNRNYSGQSILGGHAIAIIGYDEQGFIIRNSWGTGYGNRGYSNISYEDANKFLEIWTIYA